MYIASFYSAYLNDSNRLLIVSNYLPLQILLKEYFLVSVKDFNFSSILKKNWPLLIISKQAQTEYKNKYYLFILHQAFKCQITWQF